MSFSVNTNTNALAALETLNLTQQSLTKTQNRVSTGLKVASAADDASTFAIAQGQRGDIAGFQSISNSLAMGSAFVNVALQGAQTISDTLNEIKAKIVSGQDPSQDAVSIQDDINSFINQINSTASAAQFNGVNLIGATSTNVNVLASLNRAGQTVTAATITVDAHSLDAGSLGISGINVSQGTATLNTTGSTNAANNDTFAVTTTPTGGSATTTTFEFVTSGSVSLSAASNIAVTIGATFSETMANLNAALQKNGFSTAYDASGNDVISSTQGTVATSGATSGFTGTIAGSFGAGTNSAAASSTALTTIENAINTVKSALASLGTAANQLTTQTNFVKTLTDALTTGVGDLVDADLAAESAQLQSLQTKQQLGIQALSIANQGPGAVLSLFR
jgi:flagellin